MSDDERWDLVRKGKAMEEGSCSTEGKHGQGLLQLRRYDAGATSGGTK
jgi:hypothetical protein